MTPLCEEYRGADGSQQGQDPWLSHIRFTKSIEQDYIQTKPLLPSRGRAYNRALFA